MKLKKYTSLTHLKNVNDWYIEFHNNKSKDSNFLFYNYVVSMDQH